VFFLSKCVHVLCVLCRHEKSKRTCEYRKLYQTVVLLHVTCLCRNKYYSDLNIILISCKLSLALNNVKVKFSCASFKLSTTPWRRIGGVEVYLHALFGLGTIWRWMVGFTTRPLWLQGNSL